MKKNTRVKHPVILAVIRLFVVVIGGDIYDMRGDILASMKEK